MITLNIASHKKREGALKNVVLSLFNQTVKPDLINVYLNDYAVTKWMQMFMKNYDNIKFLEAPEGDLGASAKFYFVDKQERGVYITLDDDLIPNNDYVAYMSDRVYRYNTVVGLHGTMYNRHPVKSYYQDDRRHVLYCYHRLDKDISVDMLGTGALAFKVDVGLSLKDFPEPNMTDPYMFKWAKANKVPLVCLRRKEGFVKEISSAQDVAIWKGLLKGDTKQTSVINSVKDVTRQPLPNEYPVNKLSDASMEWEHLKEIGSYINKDTKVVEFGSGLSTLFLSRLTDNLYSIEHNSKWHVEGKTNLRPIKNGWYDLLPKDIDVIQDAEVILIDGPVGSTGHRYNFPFDILPFNATIFIDDCHRDKDLRQANEIGSYLGKKITFKKGRVKLLAIINK